MGPTASGKTPLAIELVQRFPMEIISVDSAMIYRGMDIGTAKPDSATLKKAPHHLIDICDPSEVYSAGRFREDALREIHEIQRRGKIPLLVGGTMLYFRVLLQGIATLPPANINLRAAITARAEREGWESLHAHLTTIDPVAAAKIHTNDAQRIQRAIEVYEITGTPISSLQEETNPLANHRVLQLGLMPTSRPLLHQRIADRLKEMLASGLVDEVRKLHRRGDLTPALPAVRSVGYRQVWDYLDSKIDVDTMQEQAIAATRQLAKRQMTWLRSWPDCQHVESDTPDLLERVLKIIELFDARRGL